MAKTSMVNREVKRAKLAKKYAAKREALKKIINSQHGDFDEKMAAAAKLQPLGEIEDSAPIDQRREDLLGRQRGDAGAGGVGRPGG